MTIIAFIGIVGTGKTLGLTYLAYKHFHNNNETIFSNYDSLTVPHTLIRTIKEFEDMKNGFAVLDELWLWVDSRLSITKKNRFTSGVVIKLRKRKVDLAYSIQHWLQIDPRVRNNTEVICIPKLNLDETICTLNFYDRLTMILIYSVKIKTKKYFPMYDTNEEINPLIF